MRKLVNGALAGFQLLSLASCTGKPSAPGCVTRLRSISRAGQAREHEH
jgi:hypothetical protein